MHNGLKLTILQNGTCVLRQHGEDVRRPTFLYTFTDSRGLSFDLFGVGLGLRPDLSSLRRVSDPVFCVHYTGDRWPQDQDVHRSWFTCRDDTEAFMLTMARTVDVHVVSLPIQKLMTGLLAWYQEEQLI